MGLVGRVGQVGRAVWWFIAAALIAGTAGAQQQPPPPRFQAKVEVTSVDVNVVDDTGKPIQNLTPSDFVVRIDGNPRRVITAEWVPLATPEKAGPGAAPPEGFSSNEASTGGRLIVIAVDEPNIRFGGAAGIARAANGFIDRLGPSDRVAIAGFGIGAPAAVFTADHARLKQVISRMTGQKRANSPGTITHSIALVEALAIDRGDRSTLETVQARECQAGPGISGVLEVEACRFQVEVEAHQIAQDSLHETDQTLQGLRNLLLGLRPIDGPKTLILISEGFLMNDDAMIVDLGRLATEARTSVYALRLDNQLFDIGDGRMPVNPFADRQARAEGLELLAGSARGTLFTVAASESPFFQRIEAELSGYYLLGVESDARDHDGKPHPIRVEVPRRGAIVRARRQVLNAPSDLRRPRTRREAAATALSSPLLTSALPLRVGSFSLQGPEQGRVQLLIHVDIGTDYAASKAISIAYMIADSNGRIVDSQANDARLQPVMTGVPSPLQYTAGASLPPGDYVLKLAASDGERAGSVEHPIHAALAQASGVTLSELMVGGPVESTDLLQPTIGYTASFGSVHGYVEAYGPQADAVTVKFEIAPDAKARSLLAQDAPGRLGGDERMIFSKAINVNALPPGKYVLRAIVSSAGKAVTTLTRGFEAAPPKVLMTSADGLGAMSVDAELFLPVEDDALRPAFHADEAVRPATVENFAARVAEPMKASFDQGLAFLAAGDFARAEASFKRVIDPDVDSTPGLAYLAASYAASGHDVEASGAWRTALVDGDDLPQLYAWLAAALMRTHDLAEARSTLEEALTKWPADTRFTKPLAMVYATFGRGREAVRTLERYLTDEPDDPEALALAVEWMYHVHSAGAVVHNRADDLKLARTYAAAYERSGGPKAALVQQWLDYLAAERH